jgi:purine-cytosine permease-like protein
MAKSVNEAENSSWIKRTFSSDNEATDDFANRKVPSNWSWGYWGIMLPITGGGTAGFFLAFGPSLASVYGSTNMLIAIVYAVVAQLILGYVLSSVSARTRLSSDLATRGLGFGYMGSLITAVIFGTNWFFYWALESQILGSALASYFHFPEQIGWLIVGIVIFIPLTIYGMVFVTKFQNWTLPIYAVWLIYNIIVIFNSKTTGHTSDFLTYMPKGQHVGGLGLLGAIAAVNGLVAVVPLLSMEFARFARKDDSPRKRFWGLVGVAAIPQNIPTWLILVPVGVLLWRASGSLNPGESFVKLTGFIGLLGLFITQIRINLQNTYAESMALSAIFARVFHFTPGRAFWSVVTCVVGTILIFANMLAYINQVLTVEAILLFTWIGVLVGDYGLVRGLFKMPVGQIEHRRAYLRKVNPIGLSSFITGSLVGLILNYGPALGYMSGSVGQGIADVASFLGFLITLVTHPLYAKIYLKREKHPYLARPEEIVPQRAITNENSIKCVSCGVLVDAEDVARCPVVDYGWICSECCSSHSTCGTKCQDKETMFPPLEQPSSM